MSGNGPFRAALYLRLSRDDEGAGESASITTQRGILRDFALAQGIAVAGEYVDDGFSGTSYERPAFRRMVEDIEAGRVNCVITKDLSRLGRNSARTSDLLDEFFPAHGVRYISVIDGYDSLHLTGGLAMTAPLMMAVHEMYARDLSCKIRASFKSKMENGEFIGSFAPYGYQKDPENKNRLVVDPEAASVVREIFRLAADGRPPGEIAKGLNGRNVPAPAAYRRLSRPQSGAGSYTGRGEWTSSGVCRLLRDTVYLGHTSQGKTVKLSFKSKATRQKSPEEWVVVKNTHEPIVSEELFRAAGSRVVARRRPPGKGFENVFSGIARCADCGRSMTTAPGRRKGSSYNLCCGGYKSRGAGECGNHFIEYDFLYDVVLQELRALLSLSDGRRAAVADALRRGEEQRRRRENAALTQSVERLERRAREVSALLKRLYEDRAFGRVSEAMYEKLSAEYDAELSGAEASLRLLRRRLEPGGGSDRDFFEALNGVGEVSVLTKPLLRKFVDRIEVGQGEYVADGQGKRRKVQKLIIFYKFSAQTE